MTAPSSARGSDRWTFLTSHARVLLRIAREPDVRLRDIAAGAGITERAAQAIVADLEAAGYLTRTRVGRRNHYTVDPSVGLRHPSEADRPVGDLLQAFLRREDAPPEDAPVEGAPVEDVPAGRIPAEAAPAPGGRTST
ncbi:MarR family transcriptional regulator [Streptomyces sp. SCUT-3]|uniref:MarR family transcriptional regulator n=1 Tax=Streptomyces sp. SCUT-3 TaxID=2684469 RepID=UPI000CB427FD|nr:helix-turn-helix domain-containing protein [Streptomyces sp. SCUT-3]PLW71840.1 transcriptional regulator [Streptomyces sp. DJ]QMV20540.1 MarR family transcriptional regulator [Streptomyces sp. SCUT-3]